MKKIWFFVEGDTEEIFISNLITKKYKNTCRQEKDLLEFVKSDIRNSDYHKVYCENCGSVDKVPHQINERYYFIEKSQTDNVIVVCDVEKLKCHSIRKEAIEKKLDESVDKSLIKYAFFNPMIESSYWECPRMIKKIIELEYKKKFTSSKVPEISLPTDVPYSQVGLKMCFKNFNLKYRETTFARQFFPRIDYETCPNQVLTRICEFLESI
ncbi:MAG: hypothetical protein JSV88_16670 [Candidatus Aminicenantes bacterium]|nr:MAG: hypothetical protein JSV88_16670 [Candidatus Aminicenantes bacterium]